MNLEANKRKKPNENVFIGSLILVVFILAWGFLAPDTFKETGAVAFSSVTKNFGWLYMISMTSFVIFSVFLFFSKFGNIVLGKDGEKPEYSFLSWFSMLFSAGMGIGLVFYGVAEPLSHYTNPISGVAPLSPEAASFAMQKSFLHWGLHPWAGYCIIALGLAYMQFRKDKPGLISSIFIPLIGEEKAKGKLGNFIDILAVFATVAGVATSLGLGAYQINSGLNLLFGIPENTFVIFIIVVVVTIGFMISAVSGLDKGIKILSNTNVILCAALMVLTFIIGPKLLILNTLTEGLGTYINSFFSQSFTLSAFSPKENSWYGGWTLFYWAWWVAWAPFVGIFIARISRGRTIRQFVGGVLLAPTLASFVWFSVFGATGIASGIVDFQTPTALFLVMQTFGGVGTLISMLTVILLCTFFVTSADSATFVLGMLTSQGNLNPSTKRKVVWGIIQSAMALALIISGGTNGLGMLQTISIVAAFPFVFVIIFSMISLYKSLQTDGDEITAPSEKETEEEAIVEPVIDPAI